MAASTESTRTTARSSTRVKPSLAPVRRDCMTWAPIRLRSTAYRILGPEFRKPFRLLSFAKVDEKFMKNSHVFQVVSFDFRQDLQDGQDDESVESKLAGFLGCVSLLLSARKPLDGVGQFPAVFPVLARRPFGLMVAV